MKKRAFAGSDKNPLRANSVPGSLSLVFKFWMKEFCLPGPLFSTCCHGSFLCIHSQTFCAYLPHFPLLSPVQWEQPTLHSSPVCKSIEFFRYHDFGVSADFNIVTSFSLGTLIGFWIPQSPGFLPIFLVISLLGKPVFYLAFLEGLVRWSSLCIWYPLLNLISEHDLSLETISKLKKPLTVVSKVQTRSVSFLGWFKVLKLTVSHIKNYIIPHCSQRAPPPSCASDASLPHCPHMQTVIEFYHLNISWIHSSLSPLSSL